MPTLLTQHPALMAVHPTFVMICQECPGQLELTRALGDAGFRPSHGVCAACKPAYSAKMKAKADAWFARNPIPACVRA